jgi:hypothetical protein
MDSPNKEDTITLDRITFIIESIETGLPNLRAHIGQGRPVEAILTLCKRGKRGGVLAGRWLAPRFADGTTGAARKWL